MKLSETVECLSREVSGLAPGPLAELRRMDVNGPGTAAYWTLAGRCGFLNCSNCTLDADCQDHGDPDPEGGARAPPTDARRQTSVGSRVV